MAHDTGHDHVDERGIVHRCYHECKVRLTDWGFWIGVTLTYPIEHFLWEKVPPFSWLLHWVLGGDH